MEHVSDQQDVVVFTSRPGEEGERRFELEEDPTGSVTLDPEAIRHEDHLVERMAERGFTLTMVGGGSRSDQVRRFYFRKRDG